MEADDLDGGAVHYRFMADNQESFAKLVRQEIQKHANVIPGSSLLLKSHEFLKQDPLKQSDLKNTNIPRPIVM